MVSVSCNSLQLGSCVTNKQLCNGGGHLFILLQVQLFIKTNIDTELKNVSRGSNIRPGSMFSST